MNGKGRTGAVRKSGQGWVGSMGRILTQTTPFTGVHVLLYLTVVFLLTLENARGISVFLVL